MMEIARNSRSIISYSLWVCSFNSSKFYGQIDASKFSLESIFNSWFALEYLARFMSCDEKKAFVKNWLNIIDVIAIMPYFLMLISGRGNSSGFSSTLKIFRITRIVRIFKLSNYSRSLRILGMI